MKCSCCGEQLKGEELESPSRGDEDNALLCDDCYHDQYEFTCFVCENGGHVSQRATGHLLIIADAEECRVPQGVYEIKEWPYYTSDLFSMWLIPEALTLLPVDIPEHAESNYPGGHVCARCEEKIRADPRPIEAQPVPSW
jgi:hypothetical protein